VKLNRYHWENPNTGDPSHSQHRPGQHCASNIPGTIPCTCHSLFIPVSISSGENLPFRLHLRRADKNGPHPAASSIQDRNNIQATLPA